VHFGCQLLPAKGINVDFRARIDSAILARHSLPSRHRNLLPSDTPRLSSRIASDLSSVDVTEAHSEGHSPPDGRHDRFLWQFKRGTEVRLQPRRVLLYLVQTDRVDETGACQTLFL
jgi:hypothetical protein